MSESATANPRVGITQLGGFITRALSSAGIPPDDARQVAALMVEADARGGDAHGIFRLPQYVKQLQSGGINARPNMRIVSDRAGAALIDGDNALGHLVMKRAAELAIEKARQCGIGWVGTRRSFTHGCLRKRT
jgi:L-2-hydroxycarboxylate dehydrogenase (NAD+)